jgi:hypothetical protein
VDSYALVALVAASFEEVHNECLDVVGYLDRSDQLEAILRLADHSSVFEDVENRPVSVEVYFEGLVGQILGPLFEAAFDLDLHDRLPPKTELAIFADRLKDLDRYWTLFKWYYC